MKYSSTWDYKNYFLVTTELFKEIVRYVLLVLIIILICEELF